MIWSEWVQKARGMENRNCADHIVEFWNRNFSGFFFYSFIRFRRPTFTFISIVKTDCSCDCIFCFVFWCVCVHVLVLIRMSSKGWRNGKRKLCRSHCRVLCIESQTGTLIFLNYFKLFQEAHINTCYKHFYYFVTEYNLIDKKELEPLVSRNRQKTLKHAKMKHKWCTQKVESMNKWNLYEADVALYLVQ